MSSISLAAVTEQAKEKYQSYDIDFGDGIVSLPPLVDLTDDQFATYQAANKRILELSKAEDAELSDLKSAFVEALVAVASDPSAHNRFSSLHLSVLMVLLEGYNTQVVDATKSTDLEKASS